MIDKRENIISLFVRKVIEKIEQKNQNHNKIESIIDEPTLTDQHSNVVLCKSYVNHFNDKSLKFSFSKYFF
jgi:hypothetical protein